MDIFTRLDHATVTAEPFPHLVLEEALDPAWCDTLIRELPPLEMLTLGAVPESNKRFTLGHTAILSDPRISDAWKETARQAMEQKFLQRLMALFAPHIRREFPRFEAEHGPLEALRAVPRQQAGAAPDTLGLDAQIAVNTPVLTPGTTVKVPHLDWMAKLIVGLLYLRPRGDDSEGGDLELYEGAEPDPVYDSERQLPRGRVRVARTVPYRRNTLVLFLNTPRSLHGVTPRGVTPHPRYFINLVGEVSKPLFEVKREAPQVAAPTPTKRSWTRIIRNLLAR